MRLSFLFGVACASLLAATGVAEVKPFTFVQISDVHVGVGENHIALEKALADIDRNVPEAAFIIASGDLTDLGFAEELTSYVETLKVTKKRVHSVVGNHDSRWSESGKENFKKIVGPTYEMWDHNGVRFINLDGAMLVEQYAHFDGVQMEQLKRDLGSMAGGQPAVITVHHPPLSGGRYFDNEFEFADLIRHHNVPLVCDGHGHSYVSYVFNNTTFAMGGSTYGPRAGYRVYKVHADRIEPSIRYVGSDKVVTEPDIPLADRGRDIPGELVEKGPGHFVVEPEGDHPLRSATYLLDGVLTGTATSEPRGEFRVDVESLPAGRHQFIATLVADDGTTHLRGLMFDTAGTGADTSPLAPGSTITREWVLGSGGQAHPLVHGDMLYVGANDGILRAIDLVSGDVKWEKDLTRETLSEPVVAGKRLVTAALDGNVYCLDAETGEGLWKFATENAVLASPLVADGRVYIGGGDSNMYAIDLESGELVWKFAAARHIKATPALAGGKLFFGAWDNWFYCVDAKTGELVWRVPASRSVGLSAATCNPGVDANRILVVTHDYSVRCLDPRFGSHLWLYRPEKDELGPSYSSPVFRDGVAYLGSINGHVVGHDMETGRKVFDVDVRPAKTDPLFDSIPLIDGDKLYVGSVGGNLYCVDIPTRKVEWSVALQPGFIFARPAKWRDRIIVSSMGNRVFEIPIAAAPSGPGSAARK